MIALLVIGIIASVSLAYFIIDLIFFICFVKPIAQCYISAMVAFLCLYGYFHLAHG